MKKNILISLLLCTSFFAAVPTWASGMDLPSYYQDALQEYQSSELGSEEPIAAITQHDIDGNGVQELFILGGNGSDLNITQIYSTDGSKAISLLNFDFLNYTGAYVFNDGRIRVPVVNDMGKQEDYYFRINADGISIHLQHCLTADFEGHPDAPYHYGNQYYTEQEYAQGIKSDIDYVRLEWSEWY